MKDQWDRRIERILTDARGREALRKVGIDVELAEDKKEKSVPIVAILCPTYRSPEPLMRDSLAEMVRFTHAQEKATVYSGPPIQASIVSWSRNFLVGEQIKSGKPWTHALFIDDDIVAEPDSLVKLLSHGKDIVAGLCTRRNDPPVPNIRFYDKETGNTEQIWEWPEDQLIEVDAVGTGFMLISQHAFEQVAQAYFDCLWERDFYAMPQDKVDALRKVRIEAFDTKKICYWFRLLPTPKGDIEMGEDVAFCHMAKKYCGISIYVDTSVQPGHLGSYPFGIKDFIPYRDLCIERAKRDGTYKSQPRVDAEIQLVG